MKTIAIATVAATLLTGVALTTSADAAPYQRHFGNVSHAERVAIARSQAHLYAIKRHARADGRVTLMERVRIRVAEARHNALVNRLRRS